MLICKTFTGGIQHILHRQIQKIYAELRKSVEIQNRMHDSVAQNFDRVSDLNDNGSTPSQGQQDEQPEGVNIPGNAIDDDVVDIMTLYPPWS